MKSILNRRTVLATMAATPAIAYSLAHAQAAWPTRTVRIIVPFPPGGGADLSARVLAGLLAPGLGQSVIVENMPGAGSAIGVEAAARSKDGHTLLMGSNSMVINPLLNPQIGYDVERDFDAVGMVSAQPLVLVVPGKSPLRSIQALIAQAKAQPGQVTAGNSGIGTLAQLTSQIFEDVAGVQLTSVAYKGESALLPDLVAGRLAMGFLNLPSVAPLIKTGQLRALAVSSPHPVDSLPGVPTVRSLNYPSLEVQGWAALVAPKGTIPQAGLERLAGLLAKALASDQVKTRFATIYVEPVIESRAATARFLASESKKYAAIIKSHGIALH